MIWGFGFGALPTEAALVNINTAEVEELDTLHGIGPAYAQRIVDYRNTNGPFEKIEDIMNVSGIGPATFADIRDLITVGSGSSGASGAGQTVSNAASAHYSADALSEPKEKKEDKLSLSAGRDRVGAVGSPLEFKAEASTNVRSGSIEWNFGDGTRGFGSPVNHTYEYPGEYVVVLHVTQHGGEALSRVNVKIVDPALVVTAAGPDRVEVRNSSQYEVNLFGRALVTKDGAFTFLRDTIIRPGQSISFSSRATGLRPASLDDVSLAVLGEDMTQPSVARAVEEYKVLVVNKLQARIAELEQKKFAMMQSARAEVEGGPDLGNSERSGLEDAQMGEETQTALVLDAVETPRLGWWETLKRFFFRER